MKTITVKYEVKSFLGINSVKEFDDLDLAQKAIDEAVASGFNRDMMKLYKITKEEI